MEQFLGQLPQDSSVTYSEKVITLTPSAPAANGAAAARAKGESPSGSRKAAKGGFVPEGAYPLDGERTVEKAREHYERCTRESLVKIHQAKFPMEGVTRQLKQDLIADILQRITLPMWSKPELRAEAAKYDVKTGARTTKDQFALGIVTQLRARGLIKARVAASASASSSSSSSTTTPAAPAVPTPGAALAPAPAPIASQPSAQAQTTLTRPTPPTAQSLFTTPLELAPAPTTSSSSSPSLSSSPLGSGGRSAVKEERSSKRKEKDSNKEKEKEKRPRKKSKSKNTDATATTPTDDQQGAARTSSQPSFVIDVVSLVDQVKSYGSAPPVATDPTNLEPERAMRLQTLDLIELLLNVGSKASNDLAFLTGHLKPHIQREKAALSSGTQWVDAHKRTLEKRQLKRKRDKAQRRLEQAQAAMAECNQQLASLRDA